MTLSRKDNSPVSTAGTPGVGGNVWLDLDIHTVEPAEDWGPCVVYMQIERLCWYRDRFLRVTPLLGMGVDIEDGGLTHFIGVTDWYVPSVMQRVYRWY